MTAQGIDMTAIRQAVALAEDVRFGGTREHIDRIAAWCRSEPELFAAVLVSLAALAASRSETVTQESVLDALAAQWVDIMPAAREGHRVYEKYRHAGRAWMVPAWAMAGERMFRRYASQRRRDQRREQRDRARAG